jgi:hypothetical protein
MTDTPVQNTDRELWREREGDYYADSIHVTKDGGIGINAGGSVFVMRLRDWHQLAARLTVPWKPLDTDTDADAADDESLRLDCLTLAVSISTSDGIDCVIGRAQKLYDFVKARDTVSGSKPDIVVNENVLRIVREKAAASDEGIAPCNS